MNNLIYRSGHLQNIITLDPSATERIEILNGPSSTVYGTDALGGVIHFKTKDPRFSTNEKWNVFGSVSSSFHTANQGKNINANLNIGGTKWASFSSVTLSSLSDLKMGKSKNPFNKNGYFGERVVYAERINGKDVLVNNDDKYLQRFSGYDQLDVLQKISFAPSASTRHSINLQYSTSSDIPRYDRLTDVNGTGLNSAEWYYGPQERFLAIYHMTTKSDGFFESYDINANYQNMTESRHNRNFGSARLSNRIEKVNIMGLQLSALHRSGNHELRTGIDGYWNGLTSTAFQKNIETEAISPLDSRYPDGDNHQINIAAYATHTFHINENFVLNDGIRLGTMRLKSVFNEKTFFPFPFDKVEQNNLVYSASVGLIYKKDGFKASYLSSLGYRTPNVDDLAKVFESTPGVIIVPNPFVKPETTFNNEINLSYFNKGWNIENVMYYTDLTNFISLSQGTFDGQPFIVYNGILSKVFTPGNGAKGYIWGVQSQIKKEINKIWSINGAYSYTCGRNKKEGGDIPLDHIAPVLIKLGADATYKKINASFFILANGQKALQDYSPSGEDNLQYAPAIGMPAWMTYHVKCQYRITN
ncbi:MAG: TonB-dependent receptor, partial [Saprospiraceae bacterium]